MACVVTASAVGAPPTLTRPCGRPVRSETRVSVPSPRLATQTEPKPMATSCGSRPTGTRRPATRFSRWSTRASVPSPELTTQTSCAPTASAVGKRPVRIGGPTTRSATGIDARDRAARAVGHPDGVRADGDVDRIAADGDPAPLRARAEHRVEAGQPVGRGARGPDGQRIGGDPQRARAGRVAAAAARARVIGDLDHVVAAGAGDPRAALADGDVGRQLGHRHPVHAHARRRLVVAARDQHGGRGREQEGHEGGEQPARGHESTPAVPGSRVAGTGALSRASAGRKAGCWAAARRCWAGAQR